MSYERIGIFGSSVFKHKSVSSLAVLNAAAANEFSNTSSSVLEAAGKWPSARAPDRPSSTR